MGYRVRLRIRNRVRVRVIVRSARAHGRRAIAGDTRARAAARLSRPNMGGGGGAEAAAPEGLVDVGAEAAGRAR